MKIKITKLVSILVLTALAVVGVSGCSTGGAVSREEFEVTRSDIEILVPADGNLSLINERTLYFRTGGTIAEIVPEEGDWVSNGDMLAKLDTVDIERAIATAEIAVESASIDLEIANNVMEQMTYPYTFRTFQFSVPSSLVSMKEAKAELNEALEKLTNGMSAIELAELRENLVQAKRDLTLAQEQLDYGSGAAFVTYANFWVLRDTQLAIEKAQLGLKVANNNLELAQEEMAKATITAPFSGQIAEVFFKEGDVISAAVSSSTPIFELIDPLHLELEATVDEIDIALVNVGLPVEISLDAIEDEMFTGEVTYISPVPLNQSGVIYYSVTITISETDIPLKAGMSAESDIVIDQRKDVLIVPDRVVYQDENGNMMVKILAGDTVEERTVTIGISNGLDTEIINGVSEGEIAVIERATDQSSGLFGG